MSKPDAWRFASGEIHVPGARGTDIGCRGHDGDGTVTPLWLIDRDPDTVVILDPEDRDAAARLCDAIPWLGAGANLVDDMQLALRSLLPKPEPEEPTGLGAVVRDGDGINWIRAAEHPKQANKWIPGTDRSAHPWFAWSELPRPITVLSAGWVEGEDAS